MGLRFHTRNEHGEEIPDGLDQVIETVEREIYEAMNAKLSNGESAAIRIAAADYLQQVRGCVSVEEVLAIKIVWPTS